MDTRLQQLSYSSCLLLHSCPRKYQLYKLEAEYEADEDAQSSITFALGHIVGAGVQSILQHKPIEKIYWESFLAWDADLFAEDTKRSKSFWESMIAIERFRHVREMLLEDWELVYYTPNGSDVPIPAVELSFIIHLPNGFKYRGFVDAVLRNKNTGEIRVLEIKTTGTNNVYPERYKNSAQAIGYSIVLDVIFPELSAYEVLYLVYVTKTKEYIPLPFKKSFLQRALWIQELLLDCELIKLYDDAGVFPMHGESCFNFYRECEHMNTCTLSTSLLTKPITPEKEAKILEDHSSFHISLSVEDLIKAQLSKTQ